MKIGTIMREGRSELVFGIGDRVYPVNGEDSRQSGGNPHSIRDLIDNPEMLDELRDRQEQRAGKGMRMDEARFLPAVGNPEKILCIGLNYRSHVEETRGEIPEHPIIFSKFNNSLAAHGEKIRIPRETSQLDYEGELGVIIGKTAHNVSKDHALDHVFGYFIGNDLSARDLQFRTQQWLLGKTSDGFFPNGPFLVTRDEVGDPQKLAIKTYVNGEVRQDSNTSSMIFPCNYLISYISQFMTLKPGDVISTGTPEGVILGMPKEKRIWLKSGDIVSVEIEKLGILENAFL